MGFLIDTGIWIAVERGQISPADVHVVTQTEPIFISPVNIAEMQVGAELIEEEKYRVKCLAVLR